MAGEKSKIPTASLPTHRCRPDRPVAGVVHDLPPILVVEDDPVATELIRQNLHRLGLANPLLLIGDGSEAVAWLSERGTGGAGPVPALVMLDGELPGRSGLEILRWLSSHPVLCRVPVLMLTAESELDGISEAHALGARSYLVKPVGFDAIGDVVRGLGLRWTILAPPGEGG